MAAQFAVGGSQGSPKPAAGACAHVRMKDMSTEQVAQWLSAQLRAALGEAKAASLATSFTVEDVNGAVLTQLVSSPGVRASFSEVFALNASECDAVLRAVAELSKAGFVPAGRDVSPALAHWSSPGRIAALETDRSVRAQTVERCASESRWHRLISYKDYRML